MDSPRRSPTDAGLPGYQCVKIRPQPSEQEPAPPGFDAWFKDLPGPKLLWRSQQVWGDVHPDESPMCYKPREVGALFGLTVEAVHSLLYSGELHGIRGAGRWMIPRPAVRAWLLTPNWETGVQPAARLMPKPDA